VIDTGTGMAPDQLARYINQLASSGREQSHTANFGVGAKVAAGSRNPHGLEYRSWHHGHGALVRFKRHRDGRWGLEPQRWPDGDHDYWRPLGEPDKPWLLRGQDHVGRHERDELYDQVGQTRGDYGRLQDFGVRFGYERVVIHLQPHVQPHRLQANTARTMLLLDHEPLPWSRWADEFTAAMPDEIRRLQEHAASTDATPRQEAIRSRVASILPLYRLSPYRAAQPPRKPAAQLGTDSADDAHAHASSRNDRPAGESHKRPSTSAAPQSAARDPARDLLSGTPAGEGPDDEARAEVSVSLPDVGWISARDGSRAEGDLEDQAARYHPGRHELTINATSERSPT
jgi:hypothetical protein